MAGVLLVMSRVLVFCVGASFPRECACLGQAAAQSRREKKQLCDTPLNVCRIGRLHHY